MYDHQKTETPPAVAATLAATGITARFFPGLTPVIVRGIYAIVTVAPTVTAPVINVKRRPTPGSATGEVSIGTLTIPVATAIGKCVYKVGFDTKIYPGEELVFDVTTAGTAGSATLGAQIDPAWEVPANNTNGVLSA